VKIERTLEKVPARLIANVKPEGTDVVMDGKVLGQDHVDEGIQPGPHTFRVTKPGYVPFEAKADVLPGDSYKLERTLKPTGWESFKQYLVQNQEPIYAQKNYFDVNFELLNLGGDRVAARRFGNGDDRNATVSRLLSPGAGATLYGVSAEYGFYGRYFGLVAASLGYSTGALPWRVSVLNATPGSEEIDVRGDFIHLRALQPQVRVALWRLQFMLQVGLEVFGGWVRERTSAEVYSTGFVALDLFVSGRAAVRINIIAGLYAQAAWRYSYPVVGFKSSNNELFSPLFGWSFGIGYGF
jgi:hypothetical protein